MATAAPDLAHALAGIPVIDVDTHWSEPDDLWTSRAPANMKDRVPQIATVGGQASWVIDGKLPIGLGATASSIVRKDRSRSRGLEFLQWRNHDVHPSSFEVKARLAMMDESGVFAQIVYPNILGFGGQNTAGVDLELRLLSTQIYNDAMAELQADSGGRIFPMALVPWWDLKAALAEVERCCAMGLRGLNINSDPHVHMGADGQQLPELCNPYWDPFWELCADRDLPINFHIGASEQSVDYLGKQGWPALTRELKAAIGGAMLFIDNGRVMGNIILSGMLDRHPKLKFVSVESGAGWIPFLIEALDYQLEQINTKIELEMRPSDYFFRNFYACFWFERRNLKTLVDMLGPDNLMFETDFPHVTCLYPKPLDYLSEALLSIEPTARAKIVSGNAAKVYNIAV
jgi:predicted TIM-barrel fold metal-dependent hydrolase